MKPEQSNSSEAISRSTPPIHQNDKTPVDRFEADELLYRRYLSEHFADGKILPASFRFPKQSFNRSLFSKPEDVLHVDCCDGVELLPKGEWGVLECQISALPSPVNTTDGRSYMFFPKHAPEPTCYAHSELWCRRDLSDTMDYDHPPTSVREIFRIRLARVMSVRIPAGANQSKK
jgi:hypothetical protein